MCDGNGGFKIQITNDPKLKDRKNRAQKCSFMNCTKKHEEHHIKQFKKWCQDDICKGQPPGAVVGWKGTAFDPTCRDWAECFAHQIDLKCLYDLACKLKKTGKKVDGKCCDDDVEDAIDTKEFRMENPPYNCTKGQNIQVPKRPPC